MIEAQFGLVVHVGKISQRAHKLVRSRNCRIPVRFDICVVKECVMKGYLRMAGLTSLTFRSTRCVVDYIWVHLILISASRLSQPLHHPIRQFSVVFRVRFRISHYIRPTYVSVPASPPSNPETVLCSDTLFTKFLGDIVIF